MKKYSARLFVTVLLTSASALGAVQQHHHGAESSDPNAFVGKFGTVHMPIACDTAAQIPFERGVAMIHSFWYEEAEKQFQAAASADPGCAMAQWGLAMTQWRPFWDGMPDDRRKMGRSEIERATALSPKSDRERRYVNALSEYLHADASRNDEALHAYNGAMGALHDAYPEDIEATAFYGLGLAAAIGTKDPVGDARKALAVLEPAFQAHPDHPGLAHYIIHTCDTPQLAREALPAAEKYASIAPASAHALHMPGHIFARLGMWQQDIESNTASVRASEYAEKNHLDGVGHEMHAYEFLLYAYLQLAEDGKAKQIAESTGAMITHLHSLPGIEHDGMAVFATYFAVELPGIYDLEMHDWKAVLTIPEPANAMTSAKYYRAWEQAIAAGHLRDGAAADTALAAANAVYDQLPDDGSPISQEKGVALGTIRAWDSFAHRNDGEALQLMSVAADMQDRVGQSEVDIPAREMYADMLLADGKPAEALVQYRLDLTLSPNRFNALYNAGRAAEAAGESHEAATYYKRLLENIRNGIDSHRPEVAYLRSYLQKERAN
jgi:tetratricopeptide (TPR) repeat protein